jgi:hypothetical protein
MTAPYPEKDINLLTPVNAPYNPNDFPQPGQTTPPQTIDPNFTYPEVDTALLPAVPGQRGPVGPAGPTGPAGPSQVISYTHTQNAVSLVWTITHNLGFVPNVTTTESAGTSIEGSVDYPSPTQVTVTFSIAVSGIAYLS